MKTGFTQKLLAVTLVMMMILASASFAVAQTATETPLVVGYDTLSEKFSPFFADTGYDRDVSSFTQVPLMTTDRMGGIIFNAIAGEVVPYNGTDYTYTGVADISVKYDEATDITTYTAKLRDDVKFSDGEPMTADDLIFSYYVYLDPSYVGSTTLNSYNIIGLKDYQTQTTSEIYTKYETLAKDILAAGDQHVWASTDSWTEDQQKAYWELIKAAWLDDVQAIVDTVMNKYAASYAKDTIGYEAAEIKGNVGLEVALGMTLWGYGEVGKKEDGTTLNGILTTKSGATFDIANGVYPTLEDYYKETYAAYKGDPDAYWNTEKADESSVTGVAAGKFITQEGSKEPAVAAGIPNISGIKKIDDYTVEVKTQGYEAPAVYSILGIEVSPLHYYGDKAQYDYENNKFGHPYGDLSIVAAKTTQPMGAGPYKFVKYENRVVYYEANEFYYKGAPKLKYVQFKETATGEVAPGVSTGTIDMGEMSGSKKNFEAVAGYNSNKEITGDVITTSKVDNLGYGYIGMNADTMNVAGEPASVASKNLRKGFATILAVYRDVAYDSYYGEAASVINYPISNTSWAAPQPTDEGYKVAFSVDVDGKDIYTSDMTADQKYAAAIEAAKGFFTAAGYTYDEATSKFTAAPEGASLTYEVYIAGGGNSDHPSFAVLDAAQKALEQIGITLKINDPADSNVMWDALDAGTQNMWCAAWQSTIDPDMYQVYHSSNIVGKGGSDSNHYHIADADLDAAIIDARKSDDQAYRKAVYKTALDLIVDWAVEVPAYQRQNCTIFSTQRVGISTLTPDITTYWGWAQDIQLVELAK